MSQQSQSKSLGVCTVCLQPFKILLSGLLHAHGRNGVRCPGSNATPRPSAPSTASSQPNSSSTSTVPGQVSSGANTASIPSVTVVLGGISSAFQTLMKNPVRLVEHIPKTARPACAELLKDILLSICKHPGDLENWVSLLSYGKAILAKPARGGRRANVSSLLFRRIEAFKAGVLPPVQSINRRPKRRVSDPDAVLAAAVTSKIEAGNLRAAVRILCSDEKPADFSDTTYNALLAKHPSQAPDSSSPPDQKSGSDCLQLDAKDIIQAVRSFPCGSAGGLDGFRPQHLKDLLGKGDEVDPLAEALADFINLLLKGFCPQGMRAYFFGGRLLALAKKDGGIRPIAVGLVWRRLAAKCANFHAVEVSRNMLFPRQLGVAIKGGAEGAVHTARSFLNNISPDKAFIKLDFKNAFNCLRRDKMLAAVSEAIPDIYNFCHLAYAESSCLCFGDRVITSAEGAQQGDPLGPLLFSVALHPVLNAMKSELVFGYLDDVSAGGAIESLADDVLLVIEGAGKLGLSLNESKCEIITADPSSVLPQIFRNFKRISLDEANLLGAPLFPGSAMDLSLESRCVELERAVDRFRLISSHDALVILKSAVGSGKLLYTLRTAPCTNHPALARFDSLQRQALSILTNCSISDVGWVQASLPVASGGLGIRSVVVLAPSAFLASAAATLGVQSSLFQNVSVLCPFVESAQSVWCDRHPDAPIPNNRTRQHDWDSASISVATSLLLSGAADAQHLARLKACMAPHSGDWLNALPISSCDLRLEDDTVRVAVALRLGLELCTPHVCPCGVMVESNGWHGLSCRRSQGRSIRHNQLNDLIFRALIRAGVMSAKEPVGLTRSDGKRPDGATLTAWKDGNKLAWDVTVPDTLAPSYVPMTVVCAGAAAEAADLRKQDKYATLPHNYIFHAVACETLGPINADGLDFLYDLSRKVSKKSGDPREKAFLFQRISVIIQRGNAAAFLGSFVDHSSSSSSHSLDLFHQC